MQTLNHLMGVKCHRVPFAQMDRPFFKDSSVAHSSFLLGSENHVHYMPGAEACVRDPTQGVLVTCPGTALHR